LAWLPADRSLIADHLGRRIAGMSADLDAPVAVVGGGQTGVECVLRLLQAGFRDIRWLGRRQWFQTIDDSPVANEFYRPAHQQFLQELSRTSRRRLVEEQEPTGDALTPGVLRVLYQANYDRMLELGRFPVTLLPGRDVAGGVTEGDDIVLTCVTTEGKEEQRVRFVVVAVGRETVDVPFDGELQARIAVDETGEMILEPDYSVRWNGGNGHRIFALNRGRMSHGIPDANLTLLPIRSAIVLNSLFGRQLFEVRDNLCPISWS
jgi:lysine/ornithine N-monooxygenase